MPLLITHRAVLNMTLADPTRQRNSNNDSSSLKKELERRALSSDVSSYDGTEHSRNIDMWMCDTCIHHRRKEETK